MSLAIEEAKKGLGKTAPNPAVGAVLVRDGRLVAKGYHRKAGGPHAEVAALRGVKNVKGATLYVTLEPCCHTDKRTPPCVDVLIRSGIKRIVVGTTDPNPKVSGKGLIKLRRAGIQIKLGILHGECRDLNPYYSYWMRTGRPWVILKAAISLDGKAAMADGRSQWITSEPARRRAHQLRSQVDGILVGIGTALKDNPRLNVRLKKNTRQPIRLLWDPDLKISPKAKIISAKQAGPTWIFTSTKNSRGTKAVRLKSGGLEVLPCGSVGKNIPAKKILSILGKRGMQSLLLEGGPGIWTEFFRQGAVQELCLFIAPKILGAEARPWIGHLGLRTLAKPFDWKFLSWEKIGSDFLLRWRLP